MIFASGLKYVGVSTTVLGWILCAVLLAVFVVWLAYVRPWQAGALEPEPPSRGPTEAAGSATPTDARAAAAARNGA